MPVHTTIAIECIGVGAYSRWVLIRINSVSIIFTSFAAVGLYREAAHMISGVNVGASVGKDKKTVGEAKRAEANITIL